jgi:hypothetical protein
MMILTQKALDEVKALLMLIEAGADGALVAQKANEVIKALGGTRDIRTMGPTAVPMYIGALLIVRGLGH